MFNLCPNEPRPLGARPDAPSVIYSLESPGNKLCMDNPKVMQKGHIDMSYRRCAQVEERFFNKHNMRFDLPFFQQAPVPFKEKKDAILYVNSNCNPKSQRREIMVKLQELLIQTSSRLQLHSFGACDRNMGEKDLQALKEAGKHNFSKPYKFCVAMENSIEQDYVTEKVYQALPAGCVPIYLGAPNINDYIPDANAIINYAQLGTPAALLSELERLSANESAYEQKLAWKHIAYKDMPPAFQRVYEQGRIGGQCRLCQVLAEHRAAPKTYTMCYANSSWRDAADSAVAKVMSGIEKLPSLQPKAPQALVALANNHWWPEAYGHDFTDRGCMYRGHPMTCRYVNLHSSNKDLTTDQRQQLASQADALLYYVCPDGQRPEGAKATVPVVAMASQGHGKSMCMSDPDIMRNVQIEMSHRSCSQVQALPYRTMETDLAMLQTLALPFADRMDAVLAQNDDCSNHSRRQATISHIRDVMEKQGSRVKLHNYGYCDQNVGEKEMQALQAEGIDNVMRRYKFCLVMEYDIEMDLISAQVFKALQAGCVPIIDGAPNLAEYVPDEAGVLVYHPRPQSAVTTLVTELSRLAADQAQYEQKLAWKKKELTELSSGAVLDKPSTTQYRTICVRHGIVPVSEPATRGDEPNLPVLAEALQVARNVSYADSMVAIVTHMPFTPQALELLNNISISPPRPLLFTSIRNPVTRTYSSYVQDACMRVARQELGEAYMDQCGGMFGGDSDILHKALENDTEAARWEYIKARQGNVNYNYMKGNASSPREVLHEYDFVFVVERMDESLVVFMLEFGLQFWDIAHLSAKNRTGKYRAAKDMPQEMNTYLETANREELQLWRLANEELDDKVAALKQRCGPDVVSDALSTFRHLQAEVFKECQNYKMWYQRRGFDYPFTHFGDQGIGPRCVQHVVSKLMRGSSIVTPQATEASDTPCGNAAAYSGATKQAVTLYT
eukprot:gene1602-1942_t